MKKYLLLAALFGSTSCFAFPEYNSLTCRGTMGGHNIVIEYHRSSHLFILNNASTIANESGNKIYTKAEYDEYGHTITIEVVSNDTDWNATLNLSIGGTTVSGPLKCQKLGMQMDSTTSIVEAISQLHIN